jgi:predicted nucleic acid-binding protein
MKILKMYLDNCCFNRPYDDQSQLSVYLETQAKLQIQQKIKNKNIELVWSTILDFENSANSDEAVKIEIEAWRKLAAVIIHQNNEIVTTANTLKSRGLKGKDSLHISCAIAANCDYFVSVDKGILKKASAVDGILIKSTIEMIEIMEAIDEN